MTQGSDDGFSDYVRLHMAGVAPTLAYLWPANGLMNVRLPASELNGQVYAQRRVARDSDTMGIQLRLTSHAAVDEAIGLLDKLVGLPRRSPSNDQEQARRQEKRPPLNAASSRRGWS